MGMNMGTGVRVQHMYLDTLKKFQRRTQKNTNFYYFIENQS